MWHSGGGTAVSLLFVPTERCPQVCYHHGSPTDPEERDRTPPGSPRPHVALLSNFISSYLPGLEPQLAVLESCLYTVRLMSPLSLQRVLAAPQVLLPHPMAPPEHPG